LAAVVMLSSTSHASFVFSFAQSTADVQLDGTVDVDLIVSNTMMNHQRSETSLFQAVLSQLLV
jgi:hypothetical protein